METLKVIEVFISSPSDVPNERAIVAEVMKDVNKLKGDALGFAFKPITWEHDVLPTLGASPQELIDENVGDSYDVFLGIMSTKFGTPTKKAGSGTEHEFNRAYDRKIESPSEIEVMFYFQEPGHSGKKIDFNELQKIENFKSSITDKGLYVPYSTEEEFKTTVTSHLAKLMDKIVEKHNASNLVTSARDTPSKESGALFDPMSLLKTVEDDDEQGFLEIAENIENSFGLASEQLEGLTRAMFRLSDEINLQSSELKGVTPQERMTHAKKFLKTSGRSMDSFVETTSAILPLFHRHLAEGLQFSRELIIIASEDGFVEKSEINEFQSSMEYMKRGMEESRESFDSLAEEIRQLPRATTSFNRSRKRIKAVIDGICKMTASAIQEVDDIIKAVET